MTNYTRKVALFAVSTAAVCALVALPGCEADTSSPGTTKDSGVVTDTTVTPGTDTNTPGTDTNTPGTDTAPAANEEMIDDMEGGTASILATKGRNGAWYVYNDGTVGAKQTPGVPFNPEKLASPRGTSKYAAHSTATGFTTWGAGFGFNLNDKGDGDGGSSKATYAASGYTGFTFWAKVSGTSSTKMRFNVSTKSTDPAGGFCTPVEKCNDDYGTDLTLTSDWTKYTVNFADLAQLGWGTAVAKFEDGLVYAVHFQFAKADFDVYVDDIAFLKK